MISYSELEPTDGAYPDDGPNNSSEPDIGMWPETDSGGGGGAGGGYLVGPSDGFHWDTFD